MNIIETYVNYVYENRPRVGQNVSNQKHKSTSLVYHVLCTRTPLCPPPHSTTIATSPRPKRKPDNLPGVKFLGLSVITHKCLKANLTIQTFLSIILCLIRIHLPMYQIQNSQALMVWTPQTTSICYDFGTVSR